MSRRLVAAVSTCFLASALISCSRARTDSNGESSGDGAVQAAQSAAAAKPETSPAGSGSPQKWALLVGINKYKHTNAISPLAGCINDIEDMRSVLIGKFDFPPGNIMMLKDEQATRAGILAAIQKHLIAKSKPGDIVVFHYSGHGSQMKDVTGKMISGVDETIVPHDSRDPEGKVFDIPGSELHGLLVQLAGRGDKKLTFILDSCHSGTLVRGKNVSRTRSIPADTRQPPPAAPYAIARGASPSGEAPPLGYAFIAAATSKESAFEHFAESKEHGALTYFLTRRLRNAKSGATYRDIMDNVMGSVTANYPSQHPQLEGIQIDQHVFSDRSSAADLYFVVQPAGAQKATLQAGSAQGMTTGSVFDVFRPGTKVFDGAAKPIASIAITSVDSFSSSAKVLSGGPIPDASRAIERQHNFGNLKLRVFVDGSTPKLEALKREIPQLGHAELAGEPETSHLQLREQRGRILVLGADSTTFSTPVPTSAPDAVDRVVGQISQWAGWFNTLSIQNSQPGMQIEMSLKAVRDGQTRDPFITVGRPEILTYEDEKVEVTLKNPTRRDLYVGIIDLSTDGTIDVIYPTVEGASPVLKAGTSVTRTFETFVPPGRSIVTDVIKAFASTKPIRPELFKREKIRGDEPLATEEDDLGQLLATARGLKPTATSGSGKPTKLSEFATAQRVLQVKTRR
jgi:hypothetical protein